MSDCKKCGVPLRKGARFCAACGEAVSADVFCAQCGTKLVAGDKFCCACGAAVKHTATPAAQEVRRRGRPPKVQAAAPKRAYPDVRGFYRGDKHVSVSERAILFFDNGKLCRVDRDMNGICADLSLYGDLAQTADGILVLSCEKRGAPLTLHTLSDGLEPRDSRVLLTPAGTEECHYTLNDRFAFAIQYTPVDAELGETHQDQVFTRFDLETGEEKRLSFPNLPVEGGYLIWVGQRLLSDGERFYISGGVANGESWNDAELVLDFDTEAVTVLWRGNGDLGRPRFFDFAKGVMWTHPREMEMKRRGWENHAGRLPLVPRKIAPNAPILANYPIWKDFPSDAHFCYFDGQQAYCAPDYYHFYGITVDGYKSEDWNQSGHGRTETAVLWQGRIIMDLMADYSYTIYPAQFSAPNREDTQALAFTDCTKK